MVLPPSHGSSYLKTVTNPVHANKSIMELMLCAVIPVPNAASSWGGVALEKAMGMLSRSSVTTFQVGRHHSPASHASSTDTRNIALAFGILLLD